MPYFLSNVYGDEHGATAIAFCVIEITPEYAALLLKRIWLVNQLKAEDQDVDHVEYWDGSGHWLGADEEASVDDESFLENIEADLAGDDAKIVVDFPFPANLERRTECDRATVKTSGVFWRTYPKHGDIELTTAEITVDQLQEIAVLADSTTRNVAAPEAITSIDGSSQTHQPRHCR